jgi:hypothetical protein
MTHFRVPKSVHFVHESDGRLTVLNGHTGHWHALNRTGADVYQELVRTSSLDHVVNQLTERYHDIPADRIRNDVVRVIGSLVQRGLLKSTAAAYVRHPDAVLMATPEEPASVPLRYRALTVVAFVLALVLLQLPFRTSTKLVEALKGRVTNRDATVQEAFRQLTTAKFVTRRYPGRVACLELSLTTVLAAALLGRRIDWCFGFATDPQRFHAWIEVGGTPVTEPTDDPILPTYRRVVRV